MIRLYKVTKEYPGSRPAVRDATLHVAPGELVLLTGPSGSGKSVLLRMLFGAEAPTSGHGVVNGRNLVRLDTATVAALRREIGLVFQDPHLIERLPVVENVALAAEVAGESRMKALARAAQMLEMFELRDLADSLPCVLSAGDRQRVGLARALVNRPVLLIADEPTGNLDPDATEQIVAHLKRVHDDGTTVFIATHDEGALTLLDCRTLMMCGGRVFEENDARLASSL